VEYVLEDGTLIASDPVENITDLDTFRLYANVPEGYLLVNPDDQDKEINAAGFSKDESAPTKIKIVVKAPVKPSWYQVEYILEDGTVIASDPIESVTDEESVHITANIPSGYELVNDTDKEKDVDTTDFSKDETAPTKIQIPVKAEIIPSWYQVEYVLEDGTVIKTEPIVKVMDEESVHVIANVPDGYELVNGTDKEKDVDTTDFSKDETAPTKIQIPVKAEIIPSWYQVEYILEDGTVIKTEPIVKVMDEESVHVIANVPDGYELVNDADAEKDVDTADFSNDETAPTIIQIPVKAEIIPSWYQVEYVLEDGTVIKTEPIVKVMDEESVHVIANVPEGYELVNDTDAEKDVDTANFSNDENAPTVIQIPIKAEIIPSWYQVEYVTEDGTVVASDPIVRIMDEESVHVTANVPDGYELVNDADAAKDVDTAGFSNDETAPTIIQIPVKAEIIPSWYQVEYILEDGTVIKTEPIVKVMDEESVHVIANVPDGYELVDAADLEKDVDTADFSNDETAPTKIQIVVKTPEAPKEDKDIDENKPEEKAGDDHNETKQNDEDEDKGKEEEGELNSDKEDRPEEKEGKKEPEKEPEAKSQTPAEKGKAAVPTAAGGLSFWNLLSSLSLSGFIVLNKRKK
jgi:methionine-rich copper-binding protein CopC